jgi:hypothetical protein
MCETAVCLHFVMCLFVRSTNCVVSRITTGYMWLPKDEIEKLLVEKLKDREVR